MVVHKFTRVKDVCMPVLFKPIEPTTKYDLGRAQKLNFVQPSKEQRKLSSRVK